MKTDAAPQMPVPETPEPIAASAVITPAREGFIRTWVVGNQYHQVFLRPGDSIRVCREADNLHDANAIIIRDGNGHDAGYLPRYDAEYLAPLLDLGAIQLEARLLFLMDTTDDGRIPVLLRIRFTPAGIALVEPDAAPTPAALMHNLFAAAWRDLPHFSPGPLRQLRDQLRHIAHDCALKPVTKLLYRLLKEPLANAELLKPLPNPFLSADA